MQVTMIALERMGGNIAIRRIGAPICRKLS